MYILPVTEDDIDDDENIADEPWQRTNAARVKPWDLDYTKPKSPPITGQVPPYPYPHPYAQQPIAYARYPLIYQQPPIMYSRNSPYSLAQYRSWRGVDNRYIMM